MKIKKIHIVGFGILHDVTLDLSPGLNILLGSNESGKTTLFEFIHRIFFGFPKGKKKKNYNPYASIMKHKTGGRLVLEHENSGEIILERFDDEKSPDTILTYSDGKTGTQEDLVSFLGSITQETYRDIFAFGLRELWDLQEQSLKRFYGAGLGLKNVFVSDVLNSLENKAQEIFKTTRGETEIRKNIVKLNQIRKEIHTLFHQKEQYDEIVLNLNKIEEELSKEKKAFDDLRDQHEHHNLLKKARPLWVEMLQSEMELAALPVFADFPKKATVRLEKISDRLNELHMQEKAINEKLSLLQAKYNEHLGKLSGLLPDIMKSNEESTIDLLEEYQKEMSLVIVLLSSLKEKNHKKETLEEKKISLQKQLTMAQMSMAPPIHTAYIPGLIAPFILAITGLIFIRRFGYMIPILIIVVSIILSLVHIITIYRKLKGFKEGKNLFEPMRKEIDSCNLLLQSLENDIRQDKSEIAAHVGKIGLPALPTIEELENKRIAINRISSDLGICKKEKDTLASSLSDIGVKKENAKTEMDQLLNSAQAPDIETFRHLAAQMEKRIQVEEAIKSAHKNLLILGFKDISLLKEELEKISLIEIDKKLQESQNLLQILIKNMNELRQKKGELLEKKRMLEMDRIPELRSRQEQVLAEIDLWGRKWCIYKMAAFLLQKAQEKYEKEKQPRVLQEAGSFFKMMTVERYERIGFSPKEKTFMIFDSKDRIKNPLILSRGTREQMYLAIRFGLIRSFESGGIVPPILTDDVLVNFDPERAQGAARAFGELSKSHQVLFFTCHPETAGFLKELFPEVRIHNL